MRCGEDREPESAEDLPIFKRLPKLLEAFLGLIGVPRPVHTIRSFSTLHSTIPIRSRHSGRNSRSAGTVIGLRSTVRSLAVVFVRFWIMVFPPFLSSEATVWEFPGRIFVLNSVKGVIKQRHASFACFVAWLDSPIPCEQRPSWVSDEIAPQTKCLRIYRNCLPVDGVPRL